MAIEDLKEFLDEETYGKVSKALEGKELFVGKGQFIPKSRFDEVSNREKELKTQIGERDSQLEILKKSAQGNEELTKQIEELKATNAKSIQDYDAKILKMQKDYELDSVLSKSGAKNQRALRGMLDIDKLEFKDGKYVGLEEQIAQVRKDNTWLFDGGMPKGVGTDPNKGNPAPNKTDSKLKAYFGIKEKQ